MQSQTWRTKMQGTAIFMALLIIAIVATITVLLMRMQQMNIRRTQMLMTSEQSYLYAQGVVDWAKVQLQEDIQNPQANNTTWPIVMRPTNLPDGQGKVTAILQDAEGLFNINNFATQHKSDASTTAATSANTTTAATTTAGQPAATEAQSTTASSSSANSAVDTEKTRLIFNNLLEAIHIDLSPDQKQSLMGGLQAWTTAINPKINNTLDPYDQQYSRLNPPYRSPHSPMVSVSELRLIQGMTSQIYNALLPYIVALPENTQVNTKHAPSLLLQALGMNGDSQNASAQASGQTNNASKYFLLRADVFFGDQHMVLYSLLIRNLNQQNPKLTKVNMLWQSFGTV